MMDELHGSRRHPARGKAQARTGRLLGQQPLHLVEDAGEGLHRRRDRRGLGEIDAGAAASAGAGSASSSRRMKPAACVTWSSAARLRWTMDAAPSWVTAVL